MPTAPHVRVRVYHGDIFSRFSSPGAECSVVLVFTTTAGADRDPLEVCEEMWELLNVGHDPDCGTPDPRAVDYRSRGNRSLTVGDVIQVDDTFYQVASIGFEPVPPPATCMDPQIGSTPLSLKEAQ